MTACAGGPNLTGDESADVSGGMRETPGLRTYPPAPACRGENSGPRGVTVFYACSRLVAATTTSRETPTKVQSAN
jgi:hypothetical protein